MTNQNIIRILTTTLGFILLLTAININTIVVSAEVYGDFEYEIKENSEDIVITKYNGNDTSVEFPEEINGRKVKEIGGAAFANCDCLKEVNIPNNIISISAGAFSGCDGLTKVTIPESVSELGVNFYSGWPFCDCTKLQEILVDENNPAYTSEDGVLFNKEMTSLIGYPAGKTDIEYNIPDGINTIGDSSFYLNKHVRRVVFSDSVKYVGNSAFGHCENLEEVIMTDNVNNIQGWAFNNCFNLEKITLPKSCSMEYGGVFCNCKKLKNVVIPDGVSGFYQQMFDGCISLEDVAIPSSVNEIGRMAFHGCNSLKKIILPSGVASLDDAFEECYSLIYIVMPDSLTDISPFSLKYIIESESTVDGESRSGQSFNLPVVIVASKNSYASNWAIENGYETVETVEEVEKASKRAKEKDKIASEKYKNQDKVSEVIKLISSIGTVTKDSKSKIEVARKAYEALNEGAKTEVINYKKLQEAEKQLAEFEKSVEDRKGSNDNAKDPNVVDDKKDDNTTKEENKQQEQKTEVVTEQPTDNATTFNINNKKTYKKSKKLTIKDADGIKSVTLNTKKIKFKSGKKNISFKLSKYKKYLKKKNKWNKLIVVDINGNKKVIQFKVK